MYKIGNYEFKTKEACIEYFGIGRTTFYQSLLTKSETELLVMLENEKKRDKPTDENISLSWEQILYAHVVDLHEHIVNDCVRESIECKCLLGRFRQAMNEKLTYQQRRIAFRRFGTNDTFPDIAKEFNITASRTHQILGEAIDILKSVKQEYIFSLPDLEQKICTLETENQILAQNLRRYEEAISENDETLPITDEMTKYKLSIAQLKNQTNELTLNVKQKKKKLQELEREINLRNQTIWKQKRELNKYDTPISNVDYNEKNTASRQPKVKNEKASNRIKVKDVKTTLGLDRSNLILFEKAHNVVADEKRTYSPEQIEWMSNMVKNKKHYISHSAVKRALGKSGYECLSKTAGFTLPVDQELDQVNLVTRFMTVSHFEELQKQLKTLTSKKQE